MHTKSWAGNLKEARLYARLRTVDNINVDWEK
jgi:hypothetical protein